MSPQDAPVLDTDRLDEGAARAMEGRAVDLADVQRRVRVRRTERRARWSGYALAVAAAVVVIALLLPGTAGLLGRNAVPAVAPSGPGSLPSTIYAPPPWTPSIADAPIARAALVMSATVAVGGLTRSQATGPVLVSADGAQYRTLPTHEGSAVSLTRTGQQVAWTSGTAPSMRATVRWMSTAGGRQHTANVSVGGRRALITQTGWSPDGRWIVVTAIWETADRTDQNAAVGDFGGRIGLSLIDTSTGRATRMCLCIGQAAFGSDTLLLMDPQIDISTLDLPPGLDAGQLPNGSDLPGAWSATPPLLLGPGGRSILTSTQGDPSQVGEPDDYELQVRQLHRNATERVNLTPLLGRLIDMRPLAWDGSSTAWIFGQRSNSEDPQIWRVPLDGGRATPVITPAPAAGEVQILSLSQDVATGGLTSAAAAPSWPWWQPQRLRWWLLGAWPWLLPGVLAAVAVAAVRRRGRRS